MVSMGMQGLLLVVIGNYGLLWVTMGYYWSLRVLMGYYGKNECQTICYCHLVQSMVGMGIQGLFIG